MLTISPRSLVRSDLSGYKSLSAGLNSEFLSASVNRSVNRLYVMKDLDFIYYLCFFRRVFS